MSLTVRGMPLRSAIVTTLIDRLARKPVAECTRVEIESARERVSTLIGAQHRAEIITELRRFLLP